MARTLRYWLVLLFTSITSVALAQQSEIYGTVTDENNEGIPNAQIFVTSGGIQQGAVVTDFDGNYSVKPLNVGTYDLRVNYSGYKIELVEGVLVSLGGPTRVNVQMERVEIVDTTTNRGAATGRPTTGSRTIDGVVVRAKRYQKPILEKVPSTTTLTADEIEKMPTRNPLDAISTSAGVYQSKSGEGLSIGGGREENTLYIVDGIQQVGSRGVANIPFGAVAQMSVITGGLPARYGDATGGVVSITTKGVTQKFQGAAGGEHSVDGYNNRQAYFNVSGPLVSRYERDTAGNILLDGDGKQRKRPVVGFALSGNYINNQDASPSYVGTYIIKEDVRRALEAAPLVAVQGVSGFPTLRNATEFVTADAFDIVDRRPRAATTNGSLLGKVDFQVGENMNLSLGAQGFFGRGDNFSRSLVSYSPDAISRSTSFTGRGFLRFTQRFPSRSTDSDRVISNAFYTLQADYQKELNNTEDPQLGRDIFKYGYLGKFYEDRTSNYSYGLDTATDRFGVRLNPGFATTNARFERSELNPVLANYTSAVFDILGYETVGVNSGIRDLRSFNALLNGDQPNWTLSRSTFTTGLSNVGSWQSAYGYSNNDQISLGVDASLDLRTRKTVHSLEFGMYYQQRAERSYNLDASLNDQGGTSSLWERAYLLTNTHFRENLDYANPYWIRNGVKYEKDDVLNGAFIPSPNDTILYNYTARPGVQSLFDLNLRRKLGLDPAGTDYINVYEIDPSLLSVDMFSADELFNSGRTHVRYLGYDYAGNRLTENVTFNDFFTQKDADGRRTRPVGAFRPNYIAGYLSDAFRFRDITFNVGVRVDRYDANTKVLKDPYSLYATRSAGQVNPPGRPSNIGDDYVVYIDNNNSSQPTIAGYRNGDDWYDPSGKRIDDPGSLKIYTGGVDPQPYLQDPNDDITDTTEGGFNPDDSFEDYTPQVNVMPRLQFSFPIADQSLFYAHYNVVVQRPRFAVALSPIDYYYLPTLAGLNTRINNPNLLPERNTDYEVGFQQAITKQSAITISAFYKERKNQIQTRQYNYAFPITYKTYGNRDFSTTKGLRVKYDLRRVGPFQLAVNYTLQFAEGTGSDANEGETLQAQVIQASLPNLRFAYPLAIDSRHNIVINADYRYFEGQGPEIAGRRPLQNTGANLILRTRSGEPYTRRLDPVSGTIVGGVNSARLPWHFGIDLNVDKDFSLRFGGRKEDAITPGRTATGRRSLFLNGFVYVKNLLNTREILNVFEYTGNPVDNGYLSFPTGQQAAAQQLSPQAYIDQYTISILDPNNFNLPRQINVGLRMNF